MNLFPYRINSEPKQIKEKYIMDDKELEYKGIKLFAITAVLLTTIVMSGITAMVSFDHVYSNKHVEKYLETHKCTDGR